MRRVAIACVLLFSACSFGASETTVLVEPTPTTTTTTTLLVTTTTEPPAVTEELTHQLVEVGDLSIQLPPTWDIVTPTAAELEQTLASGALTVSVPTVDEAELSSLILVASAPEADFGPSVSITAAPSPESIEEFSVEAIAVLEESGGIVSAATTGQTAQGLAIIISSEFEDPERGRFFVRSIHFTNGPALYTMTIVSTDAEELEELASDMLATVTY